MSYSATRRTLRLLAMLAAWTLLPAAAPRADTYPDRPIHIIIPFSPGGPNDLIARPLTDKMTQELRQSFIIENKPGANGIIAAQFVSKSPPDGYTLLMTTGSFIANQVFGTKLPYDAVTDFSAVTQLAQSYGVALMVRPDFPAKTLLELVDMAKRNPGKFTYAHSGIGNATYVAAELFRAVAGINLVKVPYKGTSTFATDIIGGQVDMGFLSTPLATPNVASGLLRCLGTTGSERAPTLPGTPTFQEVGFKEMDVLGYYGWWAPAGTPRERLDVIQREAAKALQTPEVQRVLADAGLKAVGSTPAEYAAYVAKDLAWQTEIMQRISKNPP
jgi:tripartite-type tricarboxylate transporter receptor subunit TctC